LVLRHGRMVLGVCQRILHDQHDAEDAFQASFLVLVRKAASLCHRQTIGDWLYGVAYHTALKARATSSRRREKERQAYAMFPPQPAADDAWRELQPLLDQELRRLPTPYQAAVGLWELEGKTQKEAAELLGLPEGTISSRLARGRSLLARRLGRYGMTLSVGSLAAALAETGAAAAVPTSLVQSTVDAATLVVAGQVATAGVISIHVATLTEGVLKAMILTKLKIAIAVLLIAGVVGAGAGIVTHQALAEKPAAAQDGNEQPKKEPKAPTDEMSGVVRAIDAGKSTITLANKFASKTFDVSKDVKVLLDEGTGGKLGFKEGKFSDLVEGTAVTMRLSQDQKVVGIWAEGPSVKGTLKAVDGAKNTVIVTVPGNKTEPTQDQTFTLVKDVRVVIRDHTNKEKGAPDGATLADLPVGAVVTLRLSFDRKVVGNIQAEGPEVHGVVKGVDGGKNSITISIKDGEQVQDKTFNSTPTAQIVIGEGKGQKSQQLADVPAGAIVRLRLSADQKSVLSIQAGGSSLAGVLKTVDIGKRTLTVTLTVRKGEPVEDKTFDVAKDVTVNIDGKGGQLRDLHAEVQINIKLAADQKTVNSIQAEGRTVQGTVKAVDAGNNTITIANKQSENGFSVAQGAAVVIDGEPGKLADVPTEAVVNLKLSVDQKTVLGLWAEGPSIKGVLKAVDAGKYTITVAIPVNKVDSEDKVFDVAKEARVVTQINKVPLKFADLKGEKEVVLLMSANQKAVLRITLVGE
jgi:RNA polymerase sigma factor (sigma-70 family)